MRSANEVPTMMIRRLINARYLSQTSRTLEKSSSTPPPSQAPAPAQQTPSTESSSSAQPWQKPATASHKITNFDKRILVWSGKFKNADEIPAFVA